MTNNLLKRLKDSKCQLNQYSTFVIKEELSIPIKSHCMRNSIYTWSIDGLTHMDFEIKFNKTNVNIKLKDGVELKERSGWYSIDEYIFN